jgi:UDPglucose--hexose-1-phosphate uridylyltransferase
MLDLTRHPHRRFNPLTRQWVLVSPHRAQRPWHGQVERAQAPVQPPYDPECYLCPGNARAGGVRNPAYSGTFVFDNDFAALRSDTPPEECSESALLIARGEPGLCRVVCFSPDHSLTVARMTASALRGVVDTWVEQYTEIGARAEIQYVQIFENRGEMMGCSNAHPHCQIWASHSLPNEVAAEQDSQRAHSGCLLCEYLNLERLAGARMVCENDAFTALVPFWAIWPFELLVLSRRHAASLDELSGGERDALADLLKRVTMRYDNLFQVSFPYTMGFHQKPSDGAAHPEWHLHAHFYPPLLRSAEVRKFMVGYEMLATPQRDITPETAAARLRESPEKHHQDL